MGHPRGDPISMAEIWNKLKGMSITVDFNRNDPLEARHRLIAQYNRKPSIYVESDPMKSCLSAPATIAGFLGNLFKPAANVQDEYLDRSEEKQRSPELAEGSPRSPLCDVIDLSVYNVLQRAVCYAGAGLGIVGVGLVTFFGLFTAAGAACAVTMCNKTTANCQPEIHEPVDNEVYYEGKPIVDTYNGYIAGPVNIISPMYAQSMPHYRPYGQ